MEKSSVYSRIIQVKADHLDELLHVNNVQYLHWMMESAEAHWQLRAPQVIREEFIWVVRKHSIEYTGQAVEGDELLLKTWTGEASGACWWRHFTIEKANSRTQLINAATQFVLVNRMNGKPHPVRSNIIRIFQDN
ncbi:MAG: acyl-CoA thioesterase [Bacteroidota bacterium]|jgi:acyl-CoA thioester hydrolase